MNYAYDTRGEAIRRMQGGGAPRGGDWPTPGLQDPYGGMGGEFGGPGLGPIDPYGPYGPYVPYGPYQGPPREPYFPPAPRRPYRPGMPGLDLDRYRRENPGDVRPDPRRGPAGPTDRPRGPFGGLDDRLGPPINKIADLLDTATGLVPQVGESLGLPKVVGGLGRLAGNPLLGPILGGLGLLDTGSTPGVQDPQDPQDPTPKPGNDAGGNEHGGSPEYANAVYDMWLNAFMGK